MVEHCEINRLLVWSQFLSQHSMFLDRIRKQTYQCPRYKLTKNYEKKFKFFRVPWCSNREDLSIDVSITNVGLILTKLRWFLFSGYGQTDRHGFGILTWKHVGTQKISTQSSKLAFSFRSLLYAKTEDGDA